MPISEDCFDELREKYGLAYHIPYLYNAQESVGLAGERVLEVGGSLPEELVLDKMGVKQWWSIEDFDYWTSLPEDGGGTRPDKVPAKQLTEVTEKDFTDPHHIFLGRVEELPNIMEGRFTRIFSIACFEHVLRLGLALERMYAALEPGGKLFTMFSPVWSAWEGHHIPDFKDANGRQWTKSDAPVPYWGHLLNSPPQMEQLLREKMDNQTAADLVYHIYHNPHINRFMTEDYATFFEQSPFEVVQVIPIFTVPIDPALQKELEKRCPGYKHFDNCGVGAILQKSAHSD